MTTWTTWKKDLISREFFQVVVRTKMFGVRMDEFPRARHPWVQGVKVLSIFPLKIPDCDRKPRGRGVMKCGRMRVRSVTVSAESVLASRN